MVCISQLLSWFVQVFNDFLDYFVGLYAVHAGIIAARTTFVAINATRTAVERSLYHIVEALVPAKESCMSNE